MDEIDKYEIFKQLKLNQDFVKKIKLFHVFEVYDFEDQINLIIVTTDDETYVFGGNRWGVLGFGHSNEVKNFTQNENLSNKQIVDFKNSCCHAIARTIDGKVYCWGSNYYGVLGNGRNDGERYKPELNQYLSDKNIVDICCGFEHSLVLTIDGQVYAWGQNDSGQIGNGNSGVVSIPYHVNEFDGEKVKAIACGAGHSMALTEKGKVFSWGDDKFGQLGFKKLKFHDLRNAPKLIKIGEVFDKISCGRRHSLLLSRDGDIYVFGWNKYGQLGDETIENQSETPLKLKSENKFIDIASHWLYNISMALSKEGIVFVLGQCGKEVIKTPTETRFKSFDEVFAHYFQITYRTMTTNKSQEFIEHKFIASGNFVIVPLVMTPEIDVNHETKSLVNDKKPTITTTKLKQVREKSPPPTQQLTTLNPQLKLPQINAVTDETRYKRDFKELEMIGSGTFGKVFKVLNLFDEQNYAVKKILLTEFTDELKEKSLRELKLMAKLQSDHVVQYKNSWIENSEVLYIQMELCFSTLKQILIKKRNEFQRNQFVVMTRLEYYISSEFLKETVEGLNYLHKQIPPIIHRDLKPANILITFGLNGKFVKLADFGLAVVHKFDDETHTQGLGTVNYIAPEVLHGKNYDTKSDIYSLGSVSLEIFDIDVNSSSNNSITDQLLKEKYLKIDEMVSKMIKHKKVKRPDCDQILREKSSWTLDINELEVEFSQLSLNEQSIEENFHKFFFKTKLRFR